MYPKANLKLLQLQLSQFDLILKPVQIRKRLEVSVTCATPYSTSRLIRVWYGPFRSD